MSWCDGGLQGSEVTEHDGSSIRAPYTSHTEAEDVLCSGPIRPDRRVSPEDADNHRKEFIRSKTAERKSDNTEEHVMDTKGKREVRSIEESSVSFRTS